MAQALDQNELVDFRKLMMANTIQLDALYRLLIEKGFFTEAEFLAKLRQVHADYQNKSARI